MVLCGRWAVDRDLGVEEGREGFVMCGRGREEMHSCLGNQELGG